MADLPLLLHHHETPRIDPKQDVAHRHEGGLPRRFVGDGDNVTAVLFANEARVSDANNYSYSLTSGQLTRWRYWTLLNFYAVSYGLRPWRLLKTVWNALRGRETSKMETYLVDVRRKVRVTLRAGCDKSPESCAAKFDNIANFRGFPHMPGNDVVAAYPNAKGPPMDGGSLFR